MKKVFEAFRALGVDACTSFAFGIKYCTPLCLQDSVGRYVPVV